MKRFKVRFLLFFSLFLLLPFSTHASIDLELIVSADDDRSIGENSYPIVQMGDTFRVYAQSFNNSSQDFFGYIHFFYNNGSEISINTPIFIAGNSLQDTIWFDTRFSSPGIFNLIAYITPTHWGNSDSVADSYFQVIADMNSDDDLAYDSQDSDDDNDGVLDVDEIEHGTDSLNSDSDNDGVDDGIEINSGTDPIDPDSDNDGVLDGEDDFPLDASESEDTDNDGIGNNSDSDDDNDGIPDRAEGTGGTNRVNSDSDNDGVLDGEDDFPLDASESEDTDNDGIGNNSDSDDDNDQIPDDQDIDSDGNGILDEVEELTSASDDIDEDGILNIDDNDDDNDGISDIKELKIGTNPARRDTDGDGLFDDQEIRLGTNPNNYDSDNDGLWDNDEIGFGTDPWSKDTDGDGLLDIQEIQMKSDPLDPDEDDDGISDFYDTRKNFRIIWDLGIPLMISSGKESYLDIGDSYDRDGKIISQKWYIDGKVYDTPDVKVTFSTTLPFRILSGRIYGEDDIGESSEKIFYLFIYNIWMILVSIFILFIGLIGLHRTTNKNKRI